MVFGDHRLRTSAGFLCILKILAWAGIHGGDQLEVCSSTYQYLFRQADYTRMNLSKFDRFHLYRYNHRELLDLLSTQVVTRREPQSRRDRILRQLDEKISSCFFFNIFAPELVASGDQINFESFGDDNILSPVRTPGCNIYDQGLREEENGRILY